ncbi:hypothetical protein BGX28_004122 [Mortierella sp. GBA30]|nr:hypothetical protein BGX28_004122 [Mortierella sp. GBA30]
MQPLSYNEPPGHSGARSSPSPAKSSNGFNKKLGKNSGEDVNGTAGMSTTAKQVFRSSSLSALSPRASQLHNDPQESQHQQQPQLSQFQQLHTRASSQGRRNSPSNGPNEDAGSEGHRSSGMGDGIVNQSMREDVENWLSALGLSSDVPIHVVGYFGQCRDLSMFERVNPSGDHDDRVPVYYDAYCDGSETISATTATGAQNKSWTLGLGQAKTTGDIHLYVDHSKNTLMLQHAYLYDTQDMLSACMKSLDAVNKDRSSLMKWLHDQEFESHRALLFLFLVSQVVVHTSPDMNLDPRMISVLLALSTIKRHVMQEMDRFLSICWDRIGIAPPEHQRNMTDQSGNSTVGGGGHSSSRAQNSMANIFTPGKCVPVLVFVIERVPIATPWHEPGATESQIAEQLKQQLLKKSIDATQTRLRYVFRACRLIQSIDPPAGAFDVRQLFVLPSPSSMPFVHVIPHFIGQLDLPSRDIVQLGRSADEETFDPAVAVMRQKMKSAPGAGSTAKKQHGSHAKSQISSEHKGVVGTYVSEGNGSMNMFDTPTLHELYETIVQSRDQPLIRRGLSKTGRKSSKDDGDQSSSLSLGALCQEYSGPLLRQFVDGWLKHVTIPGGYGNVTGKRNVGAVEIPSLQQWIAGYLGVCEALGISPSSPIRPSGDSSITTNSAIGSLNASQEQSDDSINSRLSKVNIAGSATATPLSGGGGGGGGGRRSGNGKKYSQRCAAMVQKKIQDYVQTDEVMEELYGQKPDLARSHSERYHQLKADQATKLFQSLAHRR